MSNQILKHTLKAGAFATALTLSTLTMTQTAQACWFSWYCNETPIVTEPVAEPTPIYEARYKLEDCPYSWWYGKYDDACAARAEQSANLAQTLNNFQDQKSSNKKKPAEWGENIWNQIFGYQQQSWSQQDDQLKLLPLTFESPDENTVFNPLRSNMLWKGDTPKVQTVSYNQKYLFQFPDDPEVIQYLLTKIQNKTGDSVADIVVTLAWASTRREEWLQLIGATGHPYVLLQNAGWVSIFDAYSAVKNKAMQWFTHHPLSEIPGFGVGIVEGFGNDIKGLYLLTGHLYYVAKAHASLLDENAFKDKKYTDAVEFFTKLKDGALALMTQEGFSNAMGSWYGNLKSELTTAWQEGNFYQHGRVLGKVTYRVVTSVYAIKGVVTAISSLQKTVVSALNKTIRDVASRSRKVIGKKHICTGSTCTKPGQCFVAGTLVWTQNGTKAIEDIKVGDIVLSRDFENRQTVFKPVTKVFVRTAPKVLNLTLAQGEKSETIGTTPEHPFFVVGRGFVSAGDLVPGMVIRQVPSDIKSQLLSEVSMNTLLKVQKLEYGNTPTTVYNFEVADTHTYVVGNSQALVHNSCGFRFSEFITRTVKESKFIENVKSSFANSRVFTRVNRFEGNIIVLRADIPLSAQNLRLMVVGKAPRVPNSSGVWEKINIHHIGRVDGKLIEVMQSMHYYNGPLHIPGPGALVRPAGFTKSYWEWRFDGWLKSGKISQGKLRNLIRQLENTDKPITRNRLNYIKSFIR